MPAFTFRRQTGGGVNMMKQLKHWQDPVNAVLVGLGLWLIVSPWALGFNTHYQATMNALVFGVAIAVLALWILLTDKDYSGWRHNWTAH